MAKKARPSAQPNPAIRLSNLRPRLDTLFTQQAEGSGLAAELDRLTDGLKPGSFLPILVGAFTGAPEARRTQLDAPTAAWLHGRGLLDDLHTLDTRYVLEGPERETARAWLAAGGLEPTAEVTLTPAELFIEAYALGDTYQGSVSVFWHEDARRRRVRVAAFLIDFQPPWEGALKDVGYFTFRDLRHAHERYFASWRSRDIEQMPVSVTEAMGRIWTALHQSQAQRIRLPADMIAVMAELVPVLLALPTDPDTPTLSLAELEHLAQNGRKPEEISRDEQRFGYQTRMDDGRIVHIIRPPDDW